MPGAPGDGYEPHALHLGRPVQQREKVLAVSPTIIEGLWRAAPWKSLPGFSLGSVWLIVPLAHHPPAVLGFVSFEILGQAHPPFVADDVAHVVRKVHTDLGTDAIVLACLPRNRSKLKI